MHQAPPAATDEVFIIRAAFVAPMDGSPLVSDAAVTFSGGKILAVGPARELQAAYPAANFNDLGQAVVLPGLINAHVHLELSALTPGERPASFVDWLKRLVPRTPPDPVSIQKFVERGVQIGVSQCLQFGITTVGDISRQSLITRPLLKNGPLRTVSFAEVQAMAQRRDFLEARITQAIDRREESDRLCIGLSPHAPYSVEPQGYLRSLAAARQNAMPLATHLAETPEETSFLANHAGDFRELWRYLDAWDDRVPTFAGGPIRYAQHLGLLDYPTVLAHVNYCNDDELAILAAGKASVVFCPRTHAYFGHPPHRWREMLSAGINVAVGTDSCASSPNLNLVDDLRLVRKMHPDVPAISLWELVTLRAARALGIAQKVGSLAPGKFADLVAFNIATDKPLEEILESDVKPTGVWIDGVTLH